MNINVGASVERQIRWMQRALNRTINARLNINGHLDQDTIHALVQFQSVNKLPVTGGMDGPTLQILEARAETFWNNLNKRFQD